jgi:hypothetical protein
MSGVTERLKASRISFMLNEFTPSGLFDLAGEGAADLMRVFEWLFGNDGERPSLIH